MAMPAENLPLPPDNRAYSCMETDLKFDNILLLLRSVIRDLKSELKNAFHESQARLEMKINQLETEMRMDIGWLKKLMWTILAVVLTTALKMFLFH